MLLRIEQLDEPTADKYEAVKVPSIQLREFGLDERALQAVLFSSLDRLFPDEELLLLAQSRKWQEEPDILALDRTGRLFIFELKVWESKQENLLQVLRYGQKFGLYEYDDLARIWDRNPNRSGTLIQDLNEKFNGELRPDQINRRQVFIVLTNGLDSSTRVAIQYWRGAQLDVRPWIYRAYRLDQQLHLELLAFRTADNPLEDLSEQKGPNFYVLNTHKNQDPIDDQDMIDGQKAAAYFDPWKRKIERLKKSDRVFLYRSGEGIVATGIAVGTLLKGPYQGNPQHRDEEYSMKLKKFVKVAPAISAAEIRTITGNRSLVFRQTMFSVSANEAEALLKEIEVRNSVDNT